MIRKSLQMALNSLVPLAAIFLAQVAVRMRYGEQAGLALGTAGNVIGIVVALSVGCLVLTLRTTAIRRKKGLDRPEQIRQGLAQEAAFGYVLSGLLVIGSLAASALLAHSSGVAPELVLPYMFASLPLIAVTPLNQVSNGFLMAFGKESRILSASLASLGGQVMVLTLVLLSTDTAATALALIAAGFSLVTLAVFLYRLRLISAVTCGGPARGMSVHGGLGTVFRPSRGALGTAPLSGLHERVIAGLDGIVYMMVFLVATVIAARHSVADGAAIASLVAFMRLIVIPLKQFGLVGGRMLLAGAPGAESFRALYRQLMPVALAAALVAAGFTAFSAPGASGGAASETGAGGVGSAAILAVLVGIQVLTEPFSGITYALLQVVHGPRSVLRILLICYLPVGLGLLLGLGLSVGLDAAGIWTVLLGVRLLFLGWVQLTARRLGLPSAPSAPRP